MHQLLLCDCSSQCLKSKSSPPAGSPGWGYRGGTQAGLRLYTMSVCVVSHMGGFMKSQHGVMKTDVFSYFLGHPEGHGADEAEDREVGGSDAPGSSCLGLSPGDAELVSSWEGSVGSAALLTAPQGQGIPYFDLECLEGHPQGTDKPRLMSQWEGLSA